MIDVRQIESLLKVNGLAKTSADEEIRSVLLSARFKEEEVETALMVLRENTVTKQTKVDGLHKVFRTDQALRPDEISKLLGIDVDITEGVNVDNVGQSNGFSLLQFIFLWTASIALAVGSVLFYMYSHEIGLFHKTSSLVIINDH